MRAIEQILHHSSAIQLECGSDFREKYCRENYRMFIDDILVSHGNSNDFKMSSVLQRKSRFFPYCHKVSSSPSTMAIILCQIQITI